MSLINGVLKMIPQLIKNMRMSYEENFISYKIRRFESNARVFFSLQKYMLATYHL